MYEQASYDRDWLKELKTELINNPARIMDSLHGVFFLSSRVPGPDSQNFRSLSLRACLVWLGWFGFPQLSLRVCLVWLSSLVIQGLFASEVSLFGLRVVRSQGHLELVSDRRAGLINA